MSYTNDITRTIDENRYVALLVVGVLLVLYPLVLGDQAVSVGTVVLAYSLFALSFNLAYGYMGEVPFGHAAFFGLGAYSGGIAIVKYGLPYPVAFVLSLVVPLVVSFLFAVFASRLIAIYFAIFSLAFGEAVRGLLLSLQWLTKGTLGLSFKRPLYLQSSVVYFYFVLVVAVVGIVALRRLVNSPFGLMVRSVRDNEQRLRSLGVNPRRVKIANLVIAGGVAGVSGMLFAPIASVLYPNLSGWQTGSVAIWSTLVGGPGIFFGPVLGAILYEPMRTLAIGFTEHWPIIEGAVLLLILLLAPEGALGLVRDKAEGMLGTAESSESESDLASDES